MLKLLNIRNFAIIDALELQFGEGLTVFTGETGAGKSIMIDALGLILGDRADMSFIRTGCEQAEITAVFDIAQHRAALDLMAAQAIQNEDNELFIRRVISKDGRSRAFINSNPVTAQLLRELGEQLVDIHGQHAHQSLTKAEAQRQMLDNFGDFGEELRQVDDTCQTWLDTSQRIATLTSQNVQEAATELLRYQVDELDALQPETGEYEGLDEEQRRLANGQRLLDTANRALNGLRDEEYSIYSRIMSLLLELRELEQFDESLAKINPIIDEAGIQIAEASDELRAYLERLDIDPDRLQQVEKRLSVLHETARKHHIQPQQLDQRLEELRTRLRDFDDNQELLDELKQQQLEALARYGVAAEKLHAKRKKTAAKMQKGISGQIRALGMPEGKIAILVEKDDGQTPRPHGKDKIEFQVSMNPGQALQALRKVASGGELSRLSLAIQVIASSGKGMSSLVFDEVDAGIGGAVAEMVGKLLCKLARRRQVLCVTHLPQVASQGDHHFQVSKSSNKTMTQTHIQTLSEEERIEEIARMLGGVKITEQTRKHADEMLGISSGT